MTMMLMKEKTTLEEMKKVKKMKKWRGGEEEKMVVQERGADLCRKDVLSECWKRETFTVELWGERFNLEYLLRKLWWAPCG